MIRWLCSSARYRLPSASSATAVGHTNWPGSEPYEAEVSEVVAVEVADADSDTVGVDRV